MGTSGTGRLMGDGSPQGGGSVSEVISQLQNIARQLSIWSQSIANATPAATSTISPTFTGVTLNNTTATLIIGTSVLRHGMILHNPATTVAYVWPTTATASLASTSLGGSLLIAGGSSVILPSSQFPNNTAGWSGIASTGSAQPFTIISFF